MRDFSSAIGGAAQRRACEEGALAAVEQYA